MTDQEFFDAVIEQTYYGNGDYIVSDTLPQIYLREQIIRAFTRWPESELVQNLKQVAEGWSLNCDALNRIISKQW